MSYEHLDARERMCIFYQRQMGHSHSTISRELARNNRPYIGTYCDRYAQSHAEQRKAIPRHVRLRNDHSLFAHVAGRPKLGWSPEIIANRIKQAFPRQEGRRVHTETIYQWIYKDATQGGEFYLYLVRCHKKRRKQQRYGSLRGHIPNRTDISERSVVVDERRRYGDWKGDAMVGRQHKGRFVTHVERKSRYLLAAKAETGTSAAFNQATLELYQKVSQNINA